MRYGLPTLLFALAMAASPARAQMQNWNPTEVTTLVVKYCGIDPSYVRVARNFDGKGRLFQSPSVKPEQTACAKRVISRAGIELTR